MHDMVEGVVGPIVRGEFRYEESLWGLVMNNMRAKRRGEHVVQPFTNGATGWLVWEVSPNLSYRLVRGNVLHHRADHRVKVRGNVLHHRGDYRVRVRSPGCDYWRPWPPSLVWA